MSSPNSINPSIKSQRAYTLDYHPWSDVTLRSKQCVIIITLVFHKILNGWRFSYSQTINYYRNELRSWVKHECHFIFTGNGTHGNDLRTRQNFLTRIHGSGRMNRCVMCEMMGSCAVIKPSSCHRKLIGFICGSENIVPIITTGIVHLLCERWYNYQHLIDTISLENLLRIFSNTQIVWIEI